MIILSQLPAQSVLNLRREGMMFVGDKGKILAEFRGQNPRLIPEKKMRDYQGAQQSPPPPESRGPADPTERDKVWVEAFKSGSPSAGNFLNARAISEAINLGAVALRVGKRIIYDAENMKISNLPEANKYLSREYRKGWEL